MSAATNFSVFPPTRVPRLAMPNPEIRKPTLMTVGSPNTVKESVVIALQEIAIPNIPEEKTPTARIHSFIADLPTTSPALDNGTPPPPMPLPPPPPIPSARSMHRGTPPLKHSTVASKPGSTPSSKQGSPEPGSISSSDTLVHGASDEAVVPIRSMFPVYNPDVRLSQQNYYPRRPAAAHNAGQTDISARDSFVQRMNYTSVIDVPLDVLNLKEPTFSSDKELEMLWEASHGSEQLSSNSSFDLEMGRLSEATFTFGSTPDTPFYSVTTYDTAEISITKVCPRKRTITCDVVMSSIEAPSRRQPPNDGLVSYIFPKMAAMLAMNQSNALAGEYSAAPGRKDIQEAALRRAANQEASNLRWNAANERYELEHPAISRTAEEPNYVASPKFSQPEQNQVIHITVATSDQSILEQPVILVTCPTSLLAPKTPATAIRSNAGSIEPVTDVHLASLDFNTRTLHVEANNILQVLPSPFAIDSVISALVSVAIADSSTNEAMGVMKIWSPKTAITNNRSSWFSGQDVATPMTGPFYATLAEREEAEEEARAAAKSHKKSVKKNRPTRLTESPQVDVDVEAGRTWYGKSKDKKQRKKQIVIGEFDLDKLTHYQSGSRQGQQLPAVTRGALGVLVGALKFVVWLLNSIVQLLVWMMVSITRGVTSEKF